MFVLTYMPCDRQATMSRSTTASTTASASQCQTSLRRTAFGYHSFTASTVCVPVVDTPWLGHTSEAYFEMEDRREDWHRAVALGALAEVGQRTTAVHRERPDVRRESGEGPQWLVVFGHRAMYCSDRGCDTSGADRRLNRSEHAQFCNELEPIFNKYAVDIVFGAHWHHQAPAAHWNHQAPAGAPTRSWQ
jgi:hypothetical protein